MRAAGSGRAFLAIFSLSFGIYLFILTKLPVRAVEPTMEWEATSVALTLAQRGEFGDPYALPTGPTAHLPPVPPAINALVYKAVGSTVTGGYAAWVVVGATWAALWGLLPWVAGRLGLPPRAGVIAGVACALVPAWPGHGEDLAALALAGIVVAFLARWETPPPDDERGRARRARRAFGLGVGCGVAFHVQPALLTVVAALLVFELLWRPSRRTAIACLLTVLGIVVACAPWAWRNYRTFGAWFFVRSNFGLELRMGNHPGADPSMDVMDRLNAHLHPRALESEARKVQKLGEVGYMRAAGHEAMAWMRAHPAEAARLAAWRVVYWWAGPLFDPLRGFLTALLTGLACVGLVFAWPRLAVPARAAVVIPLLAFPLVYYLVAYMPRYRQPVDWLFYLLAGAAVHGVVERLRRRA